MEGINGDVTRDFSEVLLSRPGVLLFVQAIFGFTYDVGYLRSRPVPRHGRHCIVTIINDVSANAAALRTLESGRGAKI